MTHADIPATRWPLRLASNRDDWSSLNCGFCGRRLMRASDRPQGLFNTRVLVSAITVHKETCDTLPKSD